VNNLSQLILACYLAGFPIIVGGLIATRRWSKNHHIQNIGMRFVIGMGAGLLLAAVSLVLIPQGLSLHPWQGVVIAFLLGSAAFCAMDRLITAYSGPHSQMIAMLIDYLPETVSLGAIFAHDHRLGIFLAFIIGAQNLPEGFNAYHEAIGAKNSPGKTLWLMFVLTFLGIPAGLLGHYLLAGHDAPIALLMTFSAGGILYLIFQDIAPLIRLKNNWLPVFGLCIGFAIAMTAHQLTI